MIIWGFKVRKKRLDEGLFFCPQEGGDRSYERRELRRWFTLFFIPLIPLKVLGEVVHCTSCGSDWDPGVLRRSTTAQVRGGVGELVTVTAAALLAQGPRTPEQLRAVTEFVGAFGGDVPGALSTDQPPPGPEDLQERASVVAADLAPAGVERLVTSALDAATVESPMTDGHRHMVTVLASGLEMSEAHFQGVLVTHGHEDGVQQPGEPT